MCHEPSCGACQDTSSALCTLFHSQPGTLIQCVFPYAEGAGAASKLE